MLNISCVDMQYCYILLVVRVSGKKNNIAMHVSLEIVNRSEYKFLMTIVDWLYEICNCF